MFISSCWQDWQDCEVSSKKCSSELKPFVDNYFFPYEDNVGEIICLVFYVISHAVIGRIFWKTEEEQTITRIPQILGITELTIPYIVHLFKFFNNYEYPWAAAIWGFLIFFVVAYVVSKCGAPLTLHFITSGACCMVITVARTHNGYNMAKNCGNNSVNDTGNAGDGGSTLKATGPSEKSPLIQGTSTAVNPTNSKGENSRSLGGTGKKRERMNEIRPVKLSPKTFEEHMAKFMQFIVVSNLGRVCQLLAAGINVNSTDSPQTENTALNYATTFASNEIDKTLCESGANVNAQNNQNDAPLHDDVCRKTESIVKILLEFGADSLITNTNGESTVDLAEKRAPELLSMFNSVAQVVHRTLSVDSMEFDRSSIISTDTAPLFSSSEKVTLGKIESWTDLIWPQPHYIKIDSSERIMKFPIDHRLKIYFNGCGDDEPRRIMQVVQTFVPYLTALSLEIEYRGHKVSDSELDGLCVEFFEDGEKPGTYTLNIRPNGIQLMGNDYAGIRHDFATLVQILRIFWISEGGRKPSTSSSITNGFMNLTEGISETSLSVIPCLSIRDYPDLTVRAVYQDFSGCKMLNVDTVLQLVNRLSYCKANYFFVNFEIRTTDRYQLPYTNRDLFHMTQVCDELFIKLVPSLDLQTNSIDIPMAIKIINLFLDDIILSCIAQFDPNITSIGVTHHFGKAAMKGLSPVATTVSEGVNNPQVTPQLFTLNQKFLCFDVDQVADAQQKLQIGRLNAKKNVAWRMRTNDPTRYIVYPNAGVLDDMLSTQTITIELVGNQFNPHHLLVIQAIHILDNESPKSIWKSLRGKTPELVQVVNLELLTTSMKLGITQQTCLGRTLQASTSVSTLLDESTNIQELETYIKTVKMDIEKVESNLEKTQKIKVALELHLENRNQRIKYLFVKNSEDEKWIELLTAMIKTQEMSLSECHLVNLEKLEIIQQSCLGRTLQASTSVSILLHESLTTGQDRIQELEIYISPMFKNARIELERSMRVLREARNAMRYEEFKLALILAEIHLVTELMILVSKIGKHLCFYGSGKAFNNSNGTSSDYRAAEHFGIHGLGVSKLPQDIPTRLMYSENVL